MNETTISFNMTEAEARVQLALGSLHKYIVVPTRPLQRPNRDDQTEDERKASYIVLAKNELVAKIKTAAFAFRGNKPISLDSLQCYDYFNATRPMGDSCPILEDVDIA